MIPYAPLTAPQAAYIRRSACAWLNVAEGGKRGGKNVVNLIAWAMSLQTHPDRLHLAAGVSVAAAKINICDSNGFGLRFIFGPKCRAGKYEGRECLYLSTATGEKVVLIAGGKKADDAARIKGHSFGSVYITEVNECHPTFLRECIDRTLSSSRRQIFLDLNPKPPRHWFYRDFLDFQDELAKAGRNPGYNYGHFTIFDNLSISDAALRRELGKYDPDSVWYRQDILGMRTVARGRIYGAYDRRSVAVTREQIAGMHFAEIAVGVDVGGTDATCATLCGVTRGYRDVVLIDGLYDKQGYDEKMTDARYARMICDWLTPWMRIYPIAIDVHVDSAAKLFRQALREELYRRGMSRASVRASDKSDGINSRIELTCMLLMQGRFKVASHLAPWHEALSMAVWDEDAYENGEWKRLDDGSFPVDALDSSEYAVTPWSRLLARAA